VLSVAELLAKIIEKREPLYGLICLSMRPTVRAEHQRTVTMGLFRPKTFSVTSGSSR